MNLALPPERAARFCAGVLAIFEDLFSIYENVFPTDGVLIGLLVGCTIVNRCGIEDHDVGKHSFLEETAVIEPQICRRQGAHAPNRFA